MRFPLSGTKGLRITRACLGGQEGVGAFRCKALDSTNEMISSRRFVLIEGMMGGEIKGLCHRLAV